MSGSIFFLHMAGAVALLLWATRMVRTGVERAYGELLRQRLRRALGNPFLAATTGLLLAVALQSSTAVTLLIGSFAGLGMVTGLSGILAVRGENWLTLNTGDEFVRIAGLVRSDDISTDNTVSSMRVADARITYSGTGAFADASQPGWLSRFFVSPLWPF